MGTRPFGGRFSADVATWWRRPWPWASAHELESMVRVRAGSLARGFFGLAFWGRPVSRNQRLPVTVFVGRPLTLRSQKRVPRLRLASNAPKQAWRSAEPRAVKWD